MLHGLERPEPIEIHGRLQLGLAEADHLRSIMLQQVIHDLLLGLLIQSSDIKGNEFELIPFRSHVSEISVDFLPNTIGECILSVFSVSDLSSSTVFVFLR